MKQENGLLSIEKLKKIVLNVLSKWPDIFSVFYKPKNSKFKIKKKQRCQLFFMLLEINENLWCFFNKKK